MISIIASAIRTQHWAEFTDSLVNNKVPYEIIFAGPVAPDRQYKNLQHIKTGNIKPAQCIYIASLYAKGDLVHWSADDCKYPDGILDDIYSMWQKHNDDKAVIACETVESGKVCPVESFTLYDDVKTSPIMAPLGFMSLKYMRELGGISDRRYTGGQYENDLLMRVYADGGSLLRYNDKQIALDHFNKHVNHNSDFSSAHRQGRRILENSWPRPGLLQRQDTFEPFENTPDLLTVSQSHKGIWD